MAERFTTRMAVFILMRNDAGEILLQQRANTGYMDGYYDFAASGHVEANEDIRMCAVRELREEVGVEARPEDLTLVHIDHYAVGENYVNFTFELTAWKGEPFIAEPDKCTDLAWFSPNNLPTKCVNTVRVNQVAGFSKPLTYSVTNETNFESLIYQG